MERIKKRISLRTALIISISLVHGILMGLFVYHSTRESRTLIIEEMKGSARSFSRMLATTAANAIISRDIGSLHEYVDRTGKEQNVSYAIIEDMDGNVLASTGGKFDGQILTDGISKKASSSSRELLQEAGNIIDVSVPISLEGKKVGLARVGISTQGMMREIAAVRGNGIRMTLFAIIAGSIVAVLISFKVTGGLARLGKVAREMTGGNLSSRVQGDPLSYRELTELGDAFNHMADAIQEREEEIQQSFEELEFAHEELQTTNEELSKANERIMEAEREGAIKRALQLAKITTRKELLDSLIEMIRDWSGCRCVGVRILDDDGSMPFESYVGFNQEFWEWENWLSTSHDQCICTRIITEHTEPQDAPITTPEGSFRVDNMHKFLGGLQSEERSRFRGNCPKFGYLSIAFVPIRYSGRILGGIHIADEKEGKLPLNLVEFIESIALLIGDAIYRINLEEKLQSSYEELEYAHEELQSTTEELQTTNEELSQANDRVMEADRLKSEFLANMSHELRTPLNSILALSGILIARMDGDLTEEQDKQVKIIQKSGKNLLELINDILDLSKIESGKMEISLEEFYLEDVVNDARAMVTPLASEKELNIILIKDETIPVIFSDRNKIKQILLNLLSNAVKFTPKGGSITISATGMDGRVELSVTDTGIGIAKENLDNIFDEFRQVDGSSTREYGGTGLGLAITRRLVKLLGGEIRVESEIGKGSTFTINIPVTLDGVEALTEAFTQIDPDKKTILAVDDDPSVIYVLKKYLEGEGYQVIPAHNGAEAIRLARELKPFAITLDIMIPGKDGWDVINELKGDPATEHIPIVVISILDNKSLGFSLGATDYLTKPVDKDTVLYSLKKLLPSKCMDCTPNVLLVDDDPIHIMAMKAVLTDSGYKVTVAPGGKEGIETLKDTTPCAIILDIMMPEVDGFMVLEELKKRKETRDVPVIILTAKDITDEDKKRLNGSIQDIIGKGNFAHEEVLRDLKNIMERRKSSDE